VPFDSSLVDYGKHSPKTVAKTKEPKLRCPVCDVPLEEDKTVFKVVRSGPFKGVPKRIHERCV